MTYRHTLHLDPGYLMEYLVRVLRGWVNYFRHGISKRIFNAIDSYTWERITSWLRTKHRIGWPELRRRFCLPGAWRLTHDGQRFPGAATVTEHLRGIALGFRNLTHYVLRCLTHSGELAQRINAL